MKGYYQIIICSISFTFVANLNGWYILIVQSTYKTADGVLTSRLNKLRASYFSAHKFCRKTGGHVLTPDFGTVKNLFKMAPNREVFYMKEFHIVDMNIFKVWAIAVRSHLKGRSCIRNAEILYSEYYSADYAPKMASYEKRFYTYCLRLVKTIDFDIRNV